MSIRQKGLEKKGVTHVVRDKRVQSERQRGTKFTRVKKEEKQVICHEKRKAETKKKVAPIY